MAGGDGTINEVANGVIHASVPFGILPAGTANILASELGFAGTMEAVARQVAEWVPRRICVGLLTADGGASHRYFLMVAGVGLDAHIVSQVDPDLKRMQGKLSYWIAGLGELGQRVGRVRRPCGRVEPPGDLRPGQPGPKLRGHGRDHAARPDCCGTTSPWPCSKAATRFAT